MKSLFLLLVSLVLVLAVCSPVVASNNTVLDATVTPEEISISFCADSLTSVDYGSLPFSATNQKPIDDPVISVCNTGTVSENFWIRGDDFDDSESGGSTWALVSTAPGKDLYNHKFGRGESPTTFDPMTKVETANELTSGGIGPDGVQKFKLRLSMPTSANIPKGHLYTTTVTVVATKR